MELLDQKDLFVSGEGGYKRYRIPALEVTQKGTVLAFCEARKYTGHDSDQIDLFLRRSVDGGRTFGGVQIVASQEGWVCGNPAPVVDRRTGVIWLLLCRNLKDGPEAMICEGRAPRTVWVTHSSDDGATWAEPREITAQVKRPEWSWYATGPGHGVQLASGRLVIPCDHIVLRERHRRDPYYSHVIYSDDGGTTWAIGGITGEGANESTAVETEDGWLYLNCRNKYALPDGGNYRRVAWSRDGGATFSPLIHDAGLPEPICEGSVRRYTCANEGGRSRVLFSNPGVLGERASLTVRLSYDECRSWPVSRIIHEGPSAYSDICVAPDMSICCFYERGAESCYEKMTFGRFNLEWLTRGQDDLGTQGK